MNAGAPSPGPRSAWMRAPATSRPTTRRNRLSSAFRASNSVRGMVTISDASALKCGSLRLQPPIDLAYGRRRPGLRHVRLMRILAFTAIESVAELVLSNDQGGSAALRRTARSAPSSGLRPRAHGRADWNAEPHRSIWRPADCTVAFGAVAFLSAKLSGSQWPRQGRLWRRCAVGYADGVGGYIVGALDTSAFEQRQERDWWPRLRARYPEPSPEASEGRRRLSLLVPRHRGNVLPGADGPGGCG